MTSDEMFALKPQIEAEIKRKQAARKIERMHVLYGRTEGAQCGDCLSFVAKKLANTYYKCVRFGDSGGPATDWRVRFPACGKFEAR
jgi:hypothetical protein